MKRKSILFAIMGGILHWQSMTSHSNYRQAWTSHTNYAENLSYTNDTALLSVCKCKGLFHVHIAGFAIGRISENKAQNGRT